MHYECHVNVKQLAKREQNLLLPCQKQSDALQKVAGLEIENISKVLSRLVYKHSCAS